MKNSRMQMILSAAMLSLLLTWNVRAALTDHDEKMNQVVPKETHMHVEEEFDPPSDPVPGSSFVKKPVLVNDGERPCFVRASVCFSQSTARQLCEPLEIGEGWSRGEDGFYYYLTALPPGGRSEALFTHVSFRSDVSQEEIRSCLPFEILVYAEAADMCDEDVFKAWELVEGGDPP